MSIPEVAVTVSDAEAVIATAEAQLGKPYELGAEGPYFFDCSGLMYFIFKAHSLLYLIGNRRGTANWYYNWFKNNGRLIEVGAGPQVGDIVFYGSPTDVTHCGIVTSASASLNLVISALANPLGVKQTRMMALKEVNGGPLPVVGFGRPAYA